MGGSSIQVYEKIKEYYHLDMEIIHPYADFTFSFMTLDHDGKILSPYAMASLLKLKEWHGYLYNPTIADAILDRIIHNAYKIELQGESQRKLKNQAKTAD